MLMMFQNSKPADQDIGMSKAPIYNFLRSTFAKNWHTRILVAE